MNTPTLAELQASLRHLRSNRNNDSIARRFYTNGFLYFVEGHATCWWCHHETLDAATEMLQLFSIQQTDHTEKFKQTMAEQLVTCEKCLRAYYGAKVGLYKRYCEIYDPRNVELVFQGIENWDVQRIQLQFARALLPSSPEGRIAVIDALAGVENVLFHKDVESSVCSFVDRCLTKGVRLDIGSTLLPGLVALCFAQHQRARDWARRALRRTGKDSSIRPESIQLVLACLLRRLPTNTPMPAGFKLSSAGLHSRAGAATFMFAADSVWHDLREVMVRLSKPCMQDLAEHFDGLVIVTCQSLVDNSSFEFLDVLRVFSELISASESHTTWPRIEQALKLTPKEFVRTIFRRKEIRGRFLDGSTAGNDLSEDNLAVCNRHLRPVRDWITPFIGSLNLPQDSPAIVALLDELLLNIRTDSRVPPTSAALAVHTGIAIIMHCLKLPPAKNIGNGGRFILAEFLNQNVNVFVDIVQGQSALSESELMISRTEELIDLMIREDLGWSLKAVSDISEHAQTILNNPDAQAELEPALSCEPPVLTHFTAMWPAILRDPKNTIVFKKSLYGVSYLLLFDPLPRNLTACLPIEWQRAYRQFEQLRTDLTGLLKPLLETLSSSLDNIDDELRTEFERDMLSAQMRLLVSSSKSVYPDVLRVLRVSSLESSDSDDDFMSIRPLSKAALDLTDSERDMACNELYERHQERLISCLTGIVHDCKILVSYSRPAYSSCSNVALLARSLLSVFSGSSSPLSSESLAQLFYSFCGLLGAILKANTEGAILSASGNSIYSSAVPTVFRTVYDMLNSTEFADYVRMAKDGQGVNENEAMDALSTCVSQMLIYLEGEDVLGVAPRIVRTFGLIANGLTAIPGASMMYPEQLVQELISGQRGCLIGEQRKLLNAITSKPVWQARRAAVSETKPVQINIDEVEAFAAMDGLDLSDVFGDVIISPDSATPSAPPSSASKPVAKPRPLATADDVIVIADTPPRSRSALTHRRNISEGEDDVVMVSGPKYTITDVDGRQPLPEPPAHSASANPEATSSAAGPTKEITFTAADATLARRKQSSMDHWLSRNRPSALTGGLASKPAAPRPAAKSKKPSGGVLSQLRSDFVQERSALVSSRLPKIPKQTVKPARALPSVPADFWMANRFDSPHPYVPTVTTVRDVSEQAKREHDREKARLANERAAVDSRDATDISSSDDDDEEAGRKGGLAGLIDVVKSPVRAPRRAVKMISLTGDTASGGIRTHDGSATFINQQARDRALAKQRAKMRLAPSLAALHKHILSWGYDSTGDLPPSIPRTALRKIPDQFEDCDKYIQTFEPLFLLESWAQFQRAKEETVSNETSTATLTAHMGEDVFRILTFTMPPAEAQLLTDGDVLVFAECLSQEKQLAQSVRVGGMAPGARFGGQNTFLGMVKKRQFGRAGAQVVICVYFEGQRLATYLNKLVLNSTWEYFNLFGLTPIHREYAALQSMPYLSESLVQEILHPRPALSRALRSTEVRECMQAHSLNQPQAESVVAAMNREHGFTLIQGPPGTGKTKTILGLAGALLSASKRSEPSSKRTAEQANNKLLICAPSNAAVDEIVKRLKSGIRNSSGRTFFPRVVRVGQPDNVSSTVRDTTLEFLTQKAMDAYGSNGTQRDPKISTAQSELLLDIVAQTHAAGKAAGAKDTQRSAHEQQRALRRQLDEANAEIRELDNQMQTVDPSNTAALSELRDNFRKVKGKKRSICQQLDQQRERARDASKTMDETRHAVRMQILQRTDILCCTLSGSGHELLTSLRCTFETVIIDEAAQSIELSCLIPLKYECERCILVGDPNQLPPTVFSQPATQHLYNQSLFVRIQRNAPDTVNLLSIQYRMHPEISALPSRLFYDSRLKDGPDMDSKQHAVWHDSGKYRPYMFFDIARGREQSGASHSVFNMDEVDAALQLVCGLCRDFPGLSWNQKIGIITPYKQQLRKLVEAFRQFIGPTATDAIEFNTVDGFQGQEKEVIIFSCVRAGDSGVGFLADRRRMNVGLTRARKSMFVLGNAQKLRVSPLWRELIDETDARSLVIKTKLPLFGRTLQRGMKLDNLLDIVASQPAQIADGEGDRSEFTMETLDEVKLSRFNQAMLSKEPPVSTSKPEADDRRGPEAVGTCNSSSRSLHPAMREAA
ncbi:DEAD-box type RNA helicase, partial [Coemansia sp. RSA 2704]